jgi:type I restriction enzyme S subunit
VSFDELKLSEADIEIIDGDRGVNYPKQNEFYDIGYCLFLNAKNVTKDGFDFNEKSFISREKDNLLRKGKLVRNDIVLTTRGTVGNVAFYNNRVPFNNIRINSGMVILRAKQSEYLPEFVYWMFRSNYIQDQINALKTGSAQPQLPITIMRTIKVLKPKLCEQKVIDATLSALDDMIELNNQINKTLEEMAQAIFKSWFVDFEPFKDGESEESEIGLIPKGWKIVELEEICSIQNGFAFKSSDYQDTGCRLIRTTNITSNGYVNNNDIKFLPQSFYESEKYKNYRFECFDTVLVMVGASIGKIGLITEYNLPSLQNQNMWRFRANNREISSVYIHYVVRRVNEFVSNWATGSARDFYRKESFQRAKCVLPPKNVMKEFRLLTDSLFIQISSNIMENALLLEIRDILLPKLMSGEIRVPVEEVV